MQTYTVQNGMENKILPQGQVNLVVIYNTITILQVRLHDGNVKNNKLS